MSSLGAIKVGLIPRRQQLRLELIVAYRNSAFRPDAPMPRGPGACLPRNANDVQPVLSRWPERAVCLAPGTEPIGGLLIH